MKELKSAILESDLTKLNLLLSQNKVSGLNDKKVKELISLSKEKGVVKIETTLLLKYKAELNSFSKKDKEKIIISLIEELSEEIYYSGWNDGIEKELWNWGSGISEPNEIFAKRVVVSDAKLAVNFGNEIGLWAEWNDKQNKPKVITLEKWIKKTND
ncbi:hypothetical protein [Winogradskyella sp. SYSU M77433]|uniref:hypothetical protein n=1 Tax=Winogradskyella sp. SYSU M77433 TaxID=3042722 RepID=UPI002480E575|nr:hypothetical protein [Winogradskyella sp. SYSU M77433]MDH7913569.1 hypothetical protein [Winogradskyella sp. SYSU M77433]